MKWSNKEIEILKNNEDKSLAELAVMLPGRNSKTISLKRIKLGLKKHRKIAGWTVDELKILQDYGKESYAHELCSLLPRHTLKGINRKLMRLKIGKHNKFWSEHMRRSHRSKNWHTATYSKLDQNLNIFSLLNETYQVLIGSLLGDGCISRNNNCRNYHFREEHGCKQKDYLLWKKQMLSIFQPCSSNNELTIVTPVHVIFTCLRQEFYDKEKCCKSYIPLKYIEKLDELGLLIWYLDDGHKHHYSPTIASGLFTHNNLQETIDVININLKLSLHIQGPCFDKRNNSPMYTIYFPISDRDKMLSCWAKLFEKYNIPECMRYKITKPTI